MEHCECECIQQMTLYSNICSQLEQKIDTKSFLENDFLALFGGTLDPNVHDLSERS